MDRRLGRTQLLQAADDHVTVHMREWDGAELATAAVAAVFVVVILLVGRWLRR